MFKRLAILLLCALFSAPALAGGYHYGSYYHYGYRHGSDAGTLLAGLLIGGLIGYVIGQDRFYGYDSHPDYRSRHDVDYYGDYDPPYYYGSWRPAYPRQVYRETVRVVPGPRRYVQIVPTWRRVVVQETSEFPGYHCRMTREYTTSIVIDGSRRAAYGTKCLIANGSWVLGPAKLVPQFD